jgi:hypothetical protein
MPVSPQPLETASAFGGRYSACLSLSSLPPVPAAHREACQRVRKMTSDTFGDIVERDMPGRDRRHAMAHIRQIAMYVCHVTLSLPIPEVAVCFGRDRSTVSITCQRVEDRREDAAFDEFVTAVEQSAKSVLEMLQAGAHD